MALPSERIAQQTTLSPSQHPANQINASSLIRASSSAAPCHVVRILDTANQCLLQETLSTAKHLPALGVSGTPKHYLLHRSTGTANLCPIYRVRVQQKRKGRPVAFESKALSEAGTMHCAGEQELAAVVHGRIKGEHPNVIQQAVQAYAAHSAALTVVKVFLKYLSYTQTGKQISCCCCC